MKSKQTEKSIFSITYFQTELFYLQQMALLDLSTTLCCGMIIEMTCLRERFEPTSVVLHQTFEGALPTELQRCDTEIGKSMGYNPALLTKM